MLQNTYSQLNAGPIADATVLLETHVNRFAMESRPIYYEYQAIHYDIPDWVHKLADEMNKLVHLARS